MADRYFSSQKIEFSENDTPEFVLDGEEAHHLLRVMRAKSGDLLTLFDGSGAEFDAVVAETGKKTVGLRILARRWEDREPAAEITLAVALPKGERQRWLIEKAVELGVACFVPLLAERSVAKVGESSDRLHRMVIEAAKQCGRNTLMKISPQMTTREIFCAPADSEAIRIFAHPGGEPIYDVLTRIHGRKIPIFAAVGPEGGFSENEISAAQAGGWQTVSLGKSILRTETAAIKIAAIFG